MTAPSVSRCISRQNQQQISFVNLKESPLVREEFWCLNAFCEPQSCSIWSFRPSQEILNQFEKDQDTLSKSLRPRLLEASGTLSVNSLNSFGLPGLLVIVNQLPPRSLESRRSLSYQGKEPQSERFKDIDSVQRRTHGPSQPSSRTAFEKFWD